MKPGNCLLGATVFGLAIGAGFAIDVNTISNTSVMQMVAVALLSSVFLFVIARGMGLMPLAVRAAAITTAVFVTGCGIVQKSGTMTRAEAAPQIAAVVSAAATENGATSDVLRQSDGHFRTTATLGTENITMLVDTGASVVLLKFEDAVAAGIDLSALKFNVPVLTANGRSHVATFTIDHIRVGAVEVTDIRGAVAEPGQLHASLLGMSFLGAIEEAVIRKDRLILRN